jgi:hypothetical protein
MSPVWHRAEPTVVDHAAVVDDQQTRAEQLDVVEVVGGEQDRGAVVPVALGEEVMMPWVSQVYASVSASE